jgi:hypothetical protein
MIDQLIEFSIILNYIRNFVNIYHLNGKIFYKLYAKHILNVLNIYEIGDINYGEVQDWAELIECKDYIDIPLNNEIITDILFILSTPEIIYPLTIERSKELQKLLAGVQL